MSPARARTSLDEIVAAGRELLEAGGVDAVTMQAVAERVGVRAPSLYKRVANRDALIAAIAGDVLLELGGRLAPLARGDDPAAALRSVAVAYRDFAHERPRAYALAYSHLAADARPPDELPARAADPIVALMEQMVGKDRALDAARTVTAFAHGFVTMEFAGAFRLGGDVDGAYRYGVETLVRALASNRRESLRLNRRGLRR